MACPDELVMALREYMIEFKLMRHDADCLRSLLNLQSNQQGSKQQDKLTNDMISSKFDNDTNESNSSDSSKSGVHVQGMFRDSPLNATNESGHPVEEEFVVEQAFQTPHQNTATSAMRPVQSPPRVQRTGEAHVMEQLPPLPEKLMRTPSAVPNLPTSYVSAVPDDTVTTLIIRSIPPKISQEHLIELWPPTWGYNFLHLPYSLKQRRSAAYAFINFVSVEAARLFYNCWEGKVLIKQSPTKALSIHPANIQGVLPNLKHLQCQGISHMKNDKHLPALFCGVDRVDFRDVLSELESTEAVATPAWQGGLDLSTSNWLGVI